MIRSKKTITKMIFVFIILVGMVMTVNAYNTKFSFDLTSGMMSPWAYSSFAYKYTDDESPVVECTYTDGCTNKFKYSVFNSNNEHRVTPLTKTGTFGITQFQRDITQKNYSYKLGATREAGSWYESANTQGQWNIDSY
ncbi:MAG: hypothetical protein GX309_07445 [Clostridiales bacterium]|nr:hypothetical protein [Clostridiales bacterium]